MRTLIPTVDRHLGASDLEDSELASLYAWPATGTVPGRELWIRTNFAQSVDGAISGNGGLSNSVSSSADKRVFGLLRATCDAVLVGAGTARAENYGPVSVRPELGQLRAEQGRDLPPPLVLVTRSCKFDPGADLFTKANSRTIVATCASAPLELRNALAAVADVVICGPETVELTALVAELERRRLDRILCEGGPHLFGDLLAAELVDDVCVTTSPTLVGGAVVDAHGNTHDPGRMTAGSAPLPDSTKLEIASLIEADGSLMSRWLVVQD